MNSSVLRSGAAAAVGGFITAFGLVVAAWDGTPAALVVAAAGVALVVAARALPSARQPRYLVLLSASLGALMYPLLVLIWLTWFYAWP